MAGIVAFYEVDIKKIIALSTLSQLGLMVFTLGLGAKMLCYYHLLVHALFKALLFLCAGCFIHGSFDNQDRRLLGSLGTGFSFSSIGFGWCNLSLMGGPFISGFYRKDIILEMSISYNYGFFLVIGFFFSIFLTSCYAVRSIFLSLLNFYMGGVKLFFYEDTKMVVGMLFLLWGAGINGAFIS